MLRLLSFDQLWLRRKRPECNANPGISDRGIRLDAVFVVRVEGVIEQEQRTSGQRDLRQTGVELRPMGSAEAHLPDRSERDGCDQDRIVGIRVVSDADGAHRIPIALTLREVMMGSVRQELVEPRYRAVGWPR